MNLYNRFFLRINLEQFTNTKIFCFKVLSTNSILVAGSSVFILIIYFRMDSEEKEEKASIISSTKTTFNSFSKKPPLPKLTRTFSVEETHKKISIHKSTNFLIRTTTQSKSKLRNYSMKKMKIEVTQP